MLHSTGVIAALVAVLAATGASCGKSRELSSASETYLEAEQLLKSVNLPIGFPMTKKIIEIMRMETEAGKGRQSEYLSDSPTFLQRVCQLDKRKCPKVLDDIKMGLKHHREQTANLVPYLQECDRRQRDFCSGRQSDSANVPDLLHENIELVFTKTGAEKGFDEIEEALGQIVDQQDEIRSIWAVCQPVASRCQQVMDEIKRIANKYQESRVNLLPYLGNCAIKQADFCLKSSARR